MRPSSPPLRPRSPPPAFGAPTPLGRFPRARTEELAPWAGVGDGAEASRKMGGVYRVLGGCGGGGGGPPGSGATLAHYGTSWDLARAKVTNLRMLVEGRHPHHWLQLEYNARQLRAVRFEIVEVVQRPRRRLVLPNISGDDGDGSSVRQDWRRRRAQRRAKRKWAHRGGDQVSSGQPHAYANPGAWVGGLPPPESLPVHAFTYDEYEAKLRRRLQAHHVRFLRGRLQVLLAGWRRMQLVPRMRVWQAVFYHQRKRERRAAATQIQRVARGRRTRQALRRWAVKRACATLQRAWRRHRAYQRVCAVRWRVVSWCAARAIQRCYRTQVARSLASVQMAFVRRSRAAGTVQRVWRGARGRRRAAHARLVKCAIRIQCRWRIRQGGLALHLKRQHARDAERARQEGAVRIQCCARQWIARADRRWLEAERLERCAVRIQTRWRMRQGKLGLMLRKKARAQKEAELAELERCALLIQTRWRIRQGGLALQMRRQAQKHAQEHERLRVRMAVRLQHWWAVVTGTYAAKLTLRAKRTARAEAVREADEMHRAALRVQACWRRRQGGLALHLKRQARAMERAEAAAASKIQLWWHQLGGDFAAKLKARAQMQQRREEIAAEARERELHAAALRVQSTWRRRQGKFALHLKRQARAAALEAAAAEGAAAKRIQVWWSHVTGSFAAKMKARAKMERVKEHRHAVASAHKIQVWWSHVTGTFAAKMKARAKMQGIKEHREQDAAAHRIQLWWSRVTGTFAAKMKARARIADMQAERERVAAASRIQLWWHVLGGDFAAKLKARAQMQTVKEDRSAHRLQLWWHRVNGTYAQRIKARARAEIHLEWKQRERAALLVQARWRAKKGQFAYHLKQKALRRLANTVDDWVRYEDEWTLRPYWHSATLDRSVYFQPDSYQDPGDWYLRLVSEGHEGYYDEWNNWVEPEEPTSCYVRLRPEDARLWKDCGESLETESLEMLCRERGLVGQGLSRNEYVASLRAWLEDADGTHHEAVWELPEGGRVVEAPKVPQPPRTFLKINGFYRRLKRTPLRETARSWRNKRPTLDRFVFRHLHPHHAKQYNRAAFQRRGSQVDLRAQAAALQAQQDAEAARRAEEEARKHVSPLKTKEDLHQYVVKAYERRRKRLMPLKFKHEAHIVKGDRVRVKGYVGGFVSLQNCVRWYPGTVLRARKNHTFDVLLDDGMKKTGCRRDQVLLDAEDTPNNSDDEGGGDPFAHRNKQADADDGEFVLGFAEAANAKKMASRLLDSIATPAELAQRKATRGLERGESRASSEQEHRGARGSSRGSGGSRSRGSTRDGLSAAFGAKLANKRADLLSRGSVPSRLSSAPRTPGPT